MMSFSGVPVFESLHLTVPYEDWSQVRSPARARRRLKRGHKQRIRHMQQPDPRIYQIAGGLHMHPETAREFRRRLEIENGQS